MDIYIPFNQNIKDLEIHDKKAFYPIKVCWGYPSNGSKDSISQSSHLTTATMKSYLEGIHVRLNASFLIIDMHTLATQFNCLKQGSNINV